MEACRLVCERCVARADGPAGTPFFMTPVPVAPAYETDSAEPLL
ncbi:hypothetical protein CBM2587_A160155 [Cupriavidus taiwanensis]|uniref:Uncharacterized protein n=1 Tax=Cupriavidus taiwanensis TaxID=164546 RepID=A0A975WVK8_9BURK|nr:hypothetical protein CBM2587_A160155 [Cupriavidus taiwanensis]